MARIEILERTKYRDQRDQEIKNAHASRGNLKVPITLRLPGNRVLVIKRYWRNRS